MRLPAQRLGPHLHRGGHGRLLRSHTVAEEDGVDVTLSTGNSVAFQRPWEVGLELDLVRWGVEPGRVCGCGDPATRRARAPPRRNGFGGVSRADRSADRGTAAAPSGWRPTLAALEDTGSLSQSGVRIGMRLHAVSGAENWSRLAQLT